MLDLQVFNFENNEVRTTIDNDNVLFVANDVAIALGYKDSNSAVNRHCKGTVFHRPLQTSGGMQEARLITEPDMYRLVFNSKLESAVRFQDWVYESVLPSIRKTGGYHIAQSIDWDELSAQINQAKSTMTLLGDSSNELLFALLKESTGVDLLALKPNIVSGVNVSHKRVGIRRYYTSEVAYKLSTTVDVVNSALLGLGFITVNNSHYELTEAGKTVGMTTTKGGLLWDKSVRKQVDKWLSENSQVM